MLYTALLIANVVQAVFFIFRMLLSTNWLSAMTSVGERASDIKAGVVWVCEGLYQIGSYLLEGILLAIFYVSIMVYSLLHYAVSWLFHAALTIANGLVSSFTYIYVNYFITPETLFQMMTMVFENFLTVGCTAIILLCLLGFSYRMYLVLCAARGRGQYVKRAAYEQRRRQALGGRQNRTAVRHRTRQQQWHEEKEVHRHSQSCDRHPQNLEERTPAVDRKPSVRAGSEMEHVRELEKQLERQMESKLCVVCMDAPRNMMIRPCNHYCICEKCGKRMKKCPVCVRAVSRIEKVYES